MNVHSIDMYLHRYYYVIINFDYSTIIFDATNANDVRFT